MELDFDKEIDALLRKARGSTVAAGAAADLAHLDADEIAAFAENALPEKTRQNYITHFAACDRCRKILSQSISLNVEAAQSAAAAPEIAAPAIGRPAWRRRLFGMQTVAYTMGALVLLFSGFLGLMVWQNMGGGARDSQVAQSEPYGATSSSNTAAANTTNAAGNAVNAAGTAANTMVAPNPGIAAQQPSSSTANADANTSTAQPMIRTPATPSDEQAKTLGQVADNKVQQPAAAAPPPAPKVLRDEAKDVDKLAQSKDDRAEIDKEKQNAGNEMQAMKREAPVTAMRSKIEPSKKAPDITPLVDGPEPGVIARTVSGRTFTKRGGVWYDADYHGQSTVNVRRGTDAYKKLDGGLRRISDNLGGTVVAVWKGKAYRIQ